MLVSFVGVDKSKEARSVVYLKCSIWDSVRHTFQNVERRAQRGLSFNGRESCLSMGKSD
jgi:hypothetical protein